MLLCIIRLHADCTSNFESVSAYFFPSTPSVLTSHSGLLLEKCSFAFSKFVPYSSNIFNLSGSSNSWKEAPGICAACSSRILTWSIATTTTFFLLSCFVVWFITLYTLSSLNPWSSWLSGQRVHFSEVAQASFDPSTVRNSVQIGLDLAFQQPKPGFWWISNDFDRFLDRQKQIHLGISWAPHRRGYSRIRVGWRRSHCNTLEQIALIATYCYFLTTSPRPSYFLYLALWEGPRVQVVGT